MKSRTRSSGGTLIRVLIIIILTVLIGGVLLFNFFFKTDGSPSSVFGIYFLRTKETSMIPEIKDGDMIIGMKTDPTNIAADDVIICQIVTRITVMRVVSVDDSTSPPAFSVKYDTVPMSDAFLISSDSVIAKAYFKSAFLGQLLDVATSVPGIIVAVIIPLTLIIIYQITRFAKDRGDDRDSNEDEDEDDYDGSEGFRRVSSKASAKLSERTADLTEMLSERALDDPAISLSAFVPEKTKPETEKKLSIDSRGRAEVKETKKLPPADSVTRQIAINAYQRYQTPEEAKKQLYSGVAPRSMTAGYKNESAPVIFLRPQTKPAPAKTVTRIDDLVKTPPTPPVQTAPKVQTAPPVQGVPGGQGVPIGQGVPGGQIVQPVQTAPQVQDIQPEQPSDLLTPKPASVIPDSIIRAQETAVETGSPGSKNTSGFDESVREYFRKEPVVIPDNLPEQTQPDIIPPGAVAPKVNIAPVRRKKSTRTVDELMKIIDAQTDKLK
jgi:signal peptidase I